MSHRRNLCVSFRSFRPYISTYFDWTYLFSSSVSQRYVSQREGTKEYQKIREYSELREGQEPQTFYRDKEKLCNEEKQGLTDANQGQMYVGFVRTNYVLSCLMESTVHL